ncbi:MAG: hypothetical protein HDS00_08235 [Bacteroides sp.]|nr:hypothetical protein [Bacteroides sp.]
MKKFLILFTVVLSVLMSACSIGKDKKEFTCDKWDVSYKNSSVADRLNTIASSALGSKATFEFYDNQIKMTFQGDQIVFKQTPTGYYEYERPYYLNGKNGNVSYTLFVRKTSYMVSSIDIWFYVDYNRVGEASFTRDW